VARIRQSRFKNNVAKQRRGRRVFNLLKRKFGFYNVPQSEVTKPFKLQVEVIHDDTTGADSISVFETGEGDMARYERHMKPIREAQKHNDY
jgi:hypothetical protein